jgi:hypothetical protein
MVAVINVFYRGNEDEVGFINVLVKYGFVHYVDSERYKDKNWVESNRKKGVIYNSKLVTYSGEYTKRELHRVERVEGPGMFVLIVDCLETNPCFYEDVEEFISVCYDGSISTNFEKYMELFDMHPVQKTIEVFAKNKRSIEDSQLSDFADSGYSFEFKKLKELDCVFFQLTKPNTDRPYVVLVKNYSKHGHKRLFSSMRMFDSWGASRYDITFLHKLWEWLGEEGGPDFDQILEDHVKACLEGEDEPKVWRNHLGNVVTDYIRNNLKICK